MLLVHAVNLLWLTYFGLGASSRSQFVFTGGRSVHTRPCQRWRLVGLGLRRRAVLCTSWGTSLKGSAVTIREAVGCRETLQLRPARVLITYNLEYVVDKLASNKVRARSAQPLVLPIEMMCKTRSHPCDDPAGLVTLNHQAQ